MGALGKHSKQLHQVSHKILNKCFFVDVIFTINYGRIKETNASQFGVFKEYNIYC
jgi:hypothetical protein